MEASCCNDSQSYHTVASCLPLSLSRRTNWVIQLQPQTECTGTSTGTNHTNKTQGPSAISHCPSDESHHTPAHSEGSRQNPDTRDDNSLAQLHSRSYSIFFSQTYDALKRSLQSTAVIFLPATLPPKERERKKKDSFYSFALMQTALRAWNIPTSPSQPAAQHNHSQPYCTRGKKTLFGLGPG